MGNITIYINGKKSLKTQTKQTTENDKWEMVEREKKKRKHEIVKDTLSLTNVKHTARIHRSLR